MSVTMPTLIFLPSGVDSALPPPPLEDSSSSPQPDGHEAAETEREHDQQMYGATRWHFASLQGM